MYKKIIMLSSICILSACEIDSNSPSDPHENEANFIVIGHRGASALRPEHTLAAYQKAMDDGADFIEPDLVSTKDGYLVARHENEIGGTTNVSSLMQFNDRKFNKVIDGATLNGWFTEDFTLSELKQLKARERIPNTRPANVKYNDQYDIPTLEQIIELAENHYKKTGKITGLYIETKHPSYFQKLNLGLEDPLLKTLSKYKYTRDIAPVYLQSFEVANLKYLNDQLKLHKSIKHVKLIQLYDAQNTMPWDPESQKNNLSYAQMASANGLKNVSKYAQGVGPSKDYILTGSSMNMSTDFIKNAHAAGLKVHPYTFRPENGFLAKDLKCNGSDATRCERGSIQEIQNFIKAGVDGVFTDDPAVARQALKQMKSSS